MPPDRSAGDDRAPGLFDQEPALTVTQLNTLARGLLEDSLGPVHVQGEISNWRPYSSGHWYFTLKDAGAEVSAVMFAAANRRVRFEPGDGLEVLVDGRVTIYPQRGRYQIVVAAMQPLREGALQLAFRQMHDRLAAEGLFAPERKRPIPLLPRRIGIATSRDGAALRDILRVLRDRFSGISIVLRDTRVQGEGAAADIAGALADLDALGDLDAVIVGRGGGSAEDLWAFNDEAVVRAIVASRAPVISAVGHETDITLADLAADLRAPTPSAAALLVVGSRDEITQRLRADRQALARQMRLALAHARRRAESFDRSRASETIAIRLRECRQALDEAASGARAAIAAAISRLARRLARLDGRLAPRALASRVTGRRVRSDALQERLLRSGPLHLAALRERLGRLGGLLNSLSPLAVLDRGYALAIGPEGGILRDAARVRSGDPVRVRLSRGGLECRVERTLPPEADPGHEDGRERRR